MKAMILSHTAPVTEKPLKLGDLPVPEPGYKQVLVKVRACGICRTDLHVIEGELPSKELPIVPGHQVVGTVVKQGSNSSRFVNGDRVGVAWLQATCEKCGFCCNGMENLCESSRYTGYHVNGGFAEYLVLNEDFAYSIPMEFSDVEAAPLLCAGIIGFRALRRSELRPKQKLALFGFGSSAHITIQVAKHWGADVFVATRGQKHQELARQMGASWVGDTFEQMPELVDSAIIFAPVGEIVPVALRALKKGGTVAMAGIYSSPIPQMNYEQHIFHEKNLRSVEANTRQDGLDLLKIAAEIPIKPVVTTYPLENANEALLDLKHDKINGTGVLVIK